MGRVSTIGAWLNSAGRQPLLTPAEELHLGTLIRAWQDHPAGPDDAPPGVRRRGLRARDRMISGNLRLVAQVVGRCRHGYNHIGDDDLPDMLQAGAMGLARGAELFDPTKGYKFSTFGYWWIRQAISRWVDWHSRTIRPPSTHAGKLARLRRTMEALQQGLGRLPTRAELARELGVEIDDLDLLIQLTTPCRSLDAQVGGDDDLSPLGELIASPAPEQDDAHAELLSRLAALPELHQQAIALAWDFDRRPRARPLTTRGIAAKLGITVERARAVLAEAESALRLVPPPKPPPPLPCTGEAVQLLLPIAPAP